MDEIAEGKTINDYVHDPSVLLQAEFSALSQAANRSLKTHCFKSQDNESSKLVSTEFCGLEFSILEV